MQHDVRLAFGERVRTLRQKRGLSQEDFAAVCRMDRTYLSGIERGKRNPSLRNLARIAERFEMTLAELFRGVKGSG